MELEFGTEDNVEACVVDVVVVVIVVCPLWDHSDRGIEQAGPWA